MFPTSCVERAVKNGQKRAAAETGMYPLWGVCFHKNRRTPAENDLYKSVRSGGRGLQGGTHGQCDVDRRVEERLPEY